MVEEGHNIQTIIAHEIEDGLRHTRIHAQGQKPSFKLVLTQSCVGRILVQHHLANSEDNKEEEVQQVVMLGDASMSSQWKA